MRCILETAVQACIFQSEKNRPTYVTLKEEYDLLAGMPDKNQRMESLLMRHNARAAFRESYRIYEQTKRSPSFTVLVNKLNSREIFKEAPKAADYLKLTFERLSKYVHPSLQRIDRTLGPKAVIPHFDSEEFDAIYESGIMALDMVQFLYIKAIAHFNNVKDIKRFLVEMSKMLGLPSEIATSFLKLPFSKRLSSGTK